MEFDSVKTDGYWHNNKIMQVFFLERYIFLKLEIENIDEVDFILFIR